LVPINAEHELSFANTRVQLTNEEMAVLAQSISDALDSVE